MLDASAIKAPLQQLRSGLEPRAEGFQRFSIEASDDLQHWASWGDEGKWRACRLPTSGSSSVK